MAYESRTVERELARIASRAHGVVTRTQLLAAAITAHEIHQRVSTGALIRVHPGVYRVGHRAPSLEVPYLAAVLACGPGALLSGRAAAYLLGRLKGQAPPPEVTTPGLVDLAAELDEDELARACHEAGVRFHTTPAQVEAVLARRPRSPGGPKLRPVMRGEIPVTLSRLESRFIRVLREMWLPLPRTNKVASERRVDCRWPERRLTVELDSYRYHSSRHAWERDRRRERDARARGDDFRRFTYGDVFDSPHQMLAGLREALGVE